MSPIIRKVAIALVVIGALLLLYVLIFMRKEDSTKSKKKLAMEVAGIAMIVAGGGVWVWLVHKRVSALKDKMKQQGKDNPKREGESNDNSGTTTGSQQGGAMMSKTSTTESSGTVEDLLFG